ncbi:unnamed protein product [Caenorhabditis angaria]|uniref:BTB domain-containing protein n=1 Tax=Caenorhabditis angaria TaxID=860376 RepID=A0A9P1I7S5_9PELO|nr:unnamed protein product [Caenorhabditis angaria]
MNPIVRKTTKIEWKFENCKELDENGKYSDDFEIDGLKWRIYIRTCVVDGKTRISACLRNAIETSNWLAEIVRDFTFCFSFLKLSTVEENAPSLCSKNSDGSSMEMSFCREDKNCVTVVCKFSYKFYDFSKNPKIFSDAVIKIGNDELHINKIYYCEISKFFNEHFVKNNNTEITINDVKSDDMMIVLAALLPDPIQITESNYNILLNLRKCETFFKDVFCPEFLRQIKSVQKEFDAFTPKKRRLWKPLEPILLLDELIAKLKRGDEFKVLFQARSLQ